MRFLYLYLKGSAEISTARTRAVRHAQGAERVAVLTSPQPTECREGCRSHVKIRTADNESNLTRTKCREGYGENAAPRIQHPHLTPAMNTYHKNPCGHTVWGKMDWAYPPVNQAGLTEIRGAPVFPPQMSAPFPRNLATLGRASRSKPSARPRAVPPFLGDDGWPTLGIWIWDQNRISWESKQRILRHMVTNLGY